MTQKYCSLREIIRFYNTKRDSGYPLTQVDLEPRLGRISFVLVGVLRQRIRIHVLLAHRDISLHG
jgi:hypothetical protein